MSVVLDSVQKSNFAGEFEGGMRLRGALLCCAVQALYYTVQSAVLLFSDPPVIGVGGALGSSGREETDGN